MRRLKQNRLQTVYIRPRSVTYDEEGVPAESFGPGFALRGEVWTATERRSVETYGDAVTGTQNVWLEGQYSMSVNGDGVPQASFGTGKVLTLGDGVCVDVDATSNPDYRVLSLTPYRFLRLEIGKR